VNTYSRTEPDFYRISEIYPLPGLTKEEIITSGRELPSKISEHSKKSQEENLQIERTLAQSIKIPCFVGSKNPPENNTTSGIQQDTDITTSNLGIRRHQSFQADVDNGHDQLSQYILAQKERISRLQDPRQSTSTAGLGRIGLGDAPTAAQYILPQVELQYAMPLSTCHRTDTVGTEVSTATVAASSLQFQTSGSYARVPFYNLY